MDNTHASAALDAVNQTRQTAARQFRTAWWYHVGVGVFIGAFIATIGSLSAGWWTGAILAFLAAGLLLRQLYRRRTGVWGYGPRSGRAGLWNVAIAVLGIGGVALVTWGHLPIWANGVVGAVVGIAAIGLGVALDASIRQRIAGGAR